MLRHGAKRVQQLEILPKPADTRAADNPWPEWPKVNRTEYGHEEATAIQGADPRHFNTRTKRFLGDANGHVREVHTIEVEWMKGADGSMHQEDVRGTDRILAADLVVLALGFSAPERTLLQQLGLRSDERGNVRTDENYMTNVPGVFSAGDMVRGPSLVVWAIRQGQAAAQSVDRYLSYGDTVL